jgi:hypothetical protein
MELLGDELKWMLISVHLEKILILAHDRCTVCAERTIGSENNFGPTRWNSMVMWVMWNVVLVRLKTELALVQDRCMVCVKRTIM